jgi:hypothetical protein
VLAAAFALGLFGPPALPAEDVDDGAPAAVPVGLAWHVEGGACDDGGAIDHGPELGLVDDPSGRRRADITLRPIAAGRVQVEIVVSVDGLVVERQLDAGSCALARNVAMLVIGAYLRGLDLERPPEPEPPEPEAPQPDEPEPEAPRPVAPPPGPPPVDDGRRDATNASRSIGDTAPRPTRAASPRRSGATWWLGTTGGASFGPIPSVTGAVGLAAAWQGSLARVHVDVTHVFRRTEIAIPGASARLSAWSFAARAGVAPRVASGRAGTLRLPVLLGLELSDVVGRPQESLRDAQVGQRLAIAAALDAGLLWSPHPRVALGVGGAVTVAALRARFVFGRPMEPPSPCRPRGASGAASGPPSWSDCDSCGGR